jgi:hypothetical protein
MWPARCSASRSPRHTPSRSAPFACTQPHALHSSIESARRVAEGLSWISPRMKSMSSLGSNLNVVSGAGRTDVSLETRPRSGRRFRLARAGPRSGTADGETRSGRARCETALRSIILSVRERKRKTPIVDGDRGRAWRRRLSRGDPSTSKWGLASHERAVVVHSRMGQAWPLFRRRSSS